MNRAGTARQWAPIRFPRRERLELSTRVVETARRVSELQLDDTTRFDRNRETLLRQLDASAGVLIVMTCDERFVPLFENWVASCDQSGVEIRQRTLLFPTDLASKEHAEDLGIVTYFDKESALLREMTGSHRYSDFEWTMYMHHQNWVIQQVLQFDVDILFQDVDVVWRHDPTPYLATHAAGGVHIQAMYDGPNPRFQPHYANSGFLYFRADPTTRQFWAEVYRHGEMVSYYQSQQEPFNVLLAAHAQRSVEVVVLDDDRFANGHRYCGNRSTPSDPWVVHHSWTVDLAEKLDRYEGNGHWFLGTEAFAAAQPTQSPPSETSTDQSPQASLADLLMAVRRDRDAIEHRLETMRSSSSWRLTAPFRAAKDRVSRARR